MIVFRLTREKYKQDLSGRGAELTGGRWNSKGIPLLYTSSSRALCVAEVAVHLPLGIVPMDYCLVEIEIPDTETIQEIAPSDLAPDWKTFPHPSSTRSFGDTFFSDQKAVALKVPSAVVPGDFNVLINPLHPNFKGVKVITTEPFVFDSRFFIR